MGLFKNGFKSTQHYYFAFKLQKYIYGLKKRHLNFHWQGGYDITVELLYYVMQIYM